MKDDSPTPWELTHALDTARRGGCVIQIRTPGSGVVRLFSIADVADMLSVHSGWVRSHIEEFPKHVKMPGGDIRIPLTDIETALDRWRTTFPVAVGKKFEIST